jgi:hypothetical protein
MQQSSIGSSRTGLDESAEILLPMTGLESQIVERAAVPLLRWTASKLKAGLLGRNDRRLVSAAVQELLAQSPNVARVEDLLARVNGNPDGLSYVRHHLEAVKKARRRGPRAGGAKKAKKAAKGREVRKIK